MAYNNVQISLSLSFSLYLLMDYEHYMVISSLKKRTIITPMAIKKRVDLEMITAVVFAL